MAPAPYHARYGIAECLPVKRDARELQRAHPVLSAYRQQEECSNFMRDEVWRTVRPTYQGLVQQIVNDRLAEAFEEDPTTARKIAETFNMVVIVLSDASLAASQTPFTRPEFSEAWVAPPVDQSPIPAGAALIQIDINPWELGKNITPDLSLPHATNFLHMLTGGEVTEAAAKTFDVALILHADHEMNASTFTARVIASTLSDMHSAITGAIGALKGPLHGGANADVMRLLLEIGKDGSPEKAASMIASVALSDAGT